MIIIVYGGFFGRKKKRSGLDVKDREMLNEFEWIGFVLVFVF